MKTETKEQALIILENTRSEFLQTARQIARTVYAIKGHVTIDDIRERIEIPENIDGRVMGAVFNRSEWKSIGFTKTKIKTSHSRPISVFVMK